MSTRPETPSLSQLFGALLELVTGAVIVAPILPGFLLCVPGLLLLAFFLAIPLVAAGLLVLAASVVAMPFMLVRFLVRRWLSRIVVRSRTALVPMPASLPSRIDAPREYALDV
jgi:hypothetical protein